MSSNIQISGPFIKALYGSLYPTRNNNNPVYAITPNLADTVPAPFRRMNTIIQNQGAYEVQISFEPDAVFGGGQTLKLYVGQTITLDNYNGPIYIISASPSDVAVLESFA